MEQVQMNRLFLGSVSPVRPFPTPSPSPLALTTYSPYHTSDRSTHSRILANSSIPTHFPLLPDDYRIRHFICMHAKKTCAPVYADASSKQIQRRCTHWYVCEWRTYIIRNTLPLQKTADRKSCCTTVTNLNSIRRSDSLHALGGCDSWERPTRHTYADTPSKYSHAPLSDALPFEWSDCTWSRIYGTQTWWYPYGFAHELSPKRISVTSNFNCWHNLVYEYSNACDRLSTPATLECWFKKGVVKPTFQKSGVEILPHCYSEISYFSPITHKNLLDNIKQ